MCWLFCMWNKWIQHWELTIRSHLHKRVHSWSDTSNFPLMIFTRGPSSCWLQRAWHNLSLTCCFHPFRSREALWWQQEQRGLKWDLCSGWRAFAAGDPAKKSSPTARRGGPLHARHFSACVTSLPGSYCVITSWLEVFIKKLEPLAEARQPPLFCAKRDASTSPSSSCIHVRKSKSSISLECLQCMYITQQQSLLSLMCCI